MFRIAVSVAVVTSFPLVAACDSGVADPGAAPAPTAETSAAAVPFSSPMTSVIGVSAQHAAIHDLISAFHGALNAQDYEAMFALWAEEATATAFGNTYEGPVAITDFFETSGPFVNGWAALAPSYRTRIEVRGNRATFAFECVYVPDTGNLTGQSVVAHLNASGTLRKVGNRWLFEEFVGGIGPLP